MRRAALTLSAAVLAAGCTTGQAARYAPASQLSGTPAPRTPVLSLSAALPALERFVETQRGLRFKHPVKVKLLGRAAFLRKLRDEQGKPSAAEVERLTATLASIGLISPKVDLVKAFRDAYDAGTLGFYDFKDKRMYVRGAKATPGVRAVLAHELTHALDDQWFKLRRPALRKDDQEKELAFTALSEGDAERTRTAYEADMSAADQAAAKREENAQSSTPKVPRTVLLLIGFPYVVGPHFVEALDTQGGNDALDRAFRHPPVSSEQLIDTAAYFSGDEPKHVATPRSDGVRVDHSDLGFVGLLLMLEKQLPAATAQAAVAGWGGDQYSTWRAGDHRWCLRDTVVTDYAVATDQLRTALHQWVARMGGRAKIEAQSGGATTFRSCSS